MTVLTARLLRVCGGFVHIYSFRNILLRKVIELLYLIRTYIAI
jgi:hypothetical protein